LLKVALTGGPGGGKSSLLQRVAQDAELSQRVAFAEEAIRRLGFMRISPRRPEFQCALVGTQVGLECGMEAAIASSPPHLLLFHRGTLDPCAFWQFFGNSRESFFEMTGTTLEDHYRRYHAVLHLQSAAVNSPETYVRYPQEHRPETIEEAARLDGLLGELWSGHPRYTLVESTVCFDGKMNQALDLLRCLTQ
jgi:predicted ATPase